LYKYILLTALSLTSLSANYEDYLLQEDTNTKPTYFVKIGAYNNLDNAIKLEEKSAVFDMQVINMQKYYSVVSQGFKSKEEASNYLAKVKKHYHDAYMFSLYKNQKIKVVMPTKKAEVKETKPSTNYQEGLSYYQAKRYEEALASFDRALIDDENDVFSRVFYAKTLYQLAIYKEAKLEFNKLLQSRLSLEDKKEVQKYLDSIESKTKRSFFNASISLGAGYDDNINLTTDEKTTKYGQYILTNDTNKTDSTYGLASLSVMHRYEAHMFDIVSSLYSYNEFAHTADGNGLNFLDIQTGISKRYNNFRFSLPFGVNSSYLEGDHVGYNIYTTPSVKYYINNNFITSLEATYLDNTSKYMSGKDYLMFGASSGLMYQSDSLESGLFASYNQFDAKDDTRFDVDKDVINGSFYSYYTLSQNFAGIYSSYAKESFNSLDTVLGYKREDKILSYGLSIGRNITNHIATTLGYRHTTNDSNINVYAYDKNNYTFNCKYRF
jgi:tetratricopeptide (TPR) repeat protein